MSEKEPISVGQKRVRFSFNTLNTQESDEIYVIKKLTADLIDLCEGLKERDARLSSLAQAAYEEAAMWAVKAATTN